MDLYILIDLIFERLFFSSLDFLAFFLDIRREFNSRANTYLII